MDERKKIVKEINLAKSQVWCLDNKLAALDEEIRKTSGYDKIGKTP